MARKTPASPKTVATKVSSRFAQMRAAATSDKAVEGYKTAATLVAIPVGAGLAYALAVKTADVALGLMA